MEFSVAEVHEAIAASRPDAECLVFRDRRLTWAEVTARTRRLANFLIDSGLGVHTEAGTDEVIGQPASAFGDLGPGESAVTKDEALGFGT